MPEQEQPGHWFVRDGSWWVCRNRCGTSRPFPSPFPKPEEVGPCAGGSGQDEPCGTCQGRGCPECES